tara:strand:+ start:8115 stop:8765 length:651 start_codon:yes stop_codon:yes gene_type:complete
MTITLEVKPREDNVSAKSLRANGSVPAVIYGQNQEATAVVLDAKVFEKVRKEAGDSTIVELAGLKDKVEALIKDVDFDPVKLEIMHVDFYAIEQGKEMTTTVHLEFIGEAPAENSKVGVVNKVIQDVEVTCKPADLPSHIDVDLSVLATLEDKITIGDLTVPKGVTINAESEDPVAVVNEVQEVNEEEGAEAPDMDAIEVEQKGKGEEAEGEAESA